MSELTELKRNWDGLARQDPLWAICSDPKKKGNRWGLPQFLESGREEIKIILDCAKLLGLKPNFFGSALDFGCGVGRLTQALSSYFASCYGVDISPRMIELAAKHNKYPDKCHYSVNDTDDLSLFQDNSFDFIYTSIVLQHMEERYAKNYLKEFIRILKPNGILMIQVAGMYKPEIDKRFLGPLRSRLRIRTRLKKLLRKTPLKEFFMEMHCFSHCAISETVSSAGASIIDTRVTNCCEDDFNGRLRFLEQEPGSGFIGKQYCIVKNA